MTHNTKIQSDAVLFDKDGTLIDFDAFWVGLSQAALQEILKQLGQSDSLVDALLESFGVHNSVADPEGVLCKGTYREMAEIFADILGTRGCEVSADALEKLVLDAYNSNAHKGDVKPTCQNLRTVLETLKNRGKKIALVTTDNQEISTLCLNKLGVLDLFDYLYTDDGTFPAKPNPQCAIAFCNAEGLDANRVVMVGDTMTDIAFARNAGLIAIGVANQEKTRALLTPCADAMIGDLWELLEILE